MFELEFNLKLMKLVSSYIVMFYSKKKKKMEETLLALYKYPLWHDYSLIKILETFLTLLIFISTLFLQFSFQFFLFLS